MTREQAGRLRGRGKRLTVGGMFRGMLWVGLAAALSVACAAPDHVSLPATLSVSPDFSPEDTETIFAAAEAWSVATNGAARLDLSVGDSGAIRIVPFNGANDVAMAETRVDASDSATMRLDVRWVDEIARPAYHVSLPDALRDTVMHELGHTFGLNHVPGGLMTPRGYGGNAVDPDSRSRFCSTYSCN